uniref:RBR-type E3 ubiquitin transferase n=1 Tax=Mucochytrium quahogii TaxID=96639 RepID=A0A7S2S2E0_9STRA|mmetsp:Transcript_2065/g.3062  ORF Transcript_2065/g.3062 Transcript_2065/m.3062 type:complete len:445 (-) Transcript_2065:1139-2473(-)
MGQIESCTSRVKVPKENVNFLQWDDLYRANGQPQRLTGAQADLAKLESERRTSENGDDYVPLSERTRLANQTLRKTSGSHKYNASIRSSELRRGMFVEALFLETWCRAQVMRVTANRFRIHYCGRSKGYDEWIRFEDLDRIRTPGPENLPSSFDIKRVEQREDAVVARNRRRPSVRVPGGDSDRCETETYQFGDDARRARNRKGQNRKGKPQRIQLGPVRTCGICLEETVGNECPLSCDHFVCAECFVNYLRHGMGDVSQFPLKCPSHISGCEETITLEQAIPYLTPKEVNVFKDRSTQACIQSAGLQLVYCPEKSCGAANELVHGLSDSATLSCAYCGLVFTNPKVAEQQDQGGVDKLAEREGFQRCPECKKWIEKSEGCNHMTHTSEMGCTKKRTDFCYLCGDELGGNFYQYEVLHPDTLHFPTECGIFGLCRKLLGYDVKG